MTLNAILKIEGYIITFLDSCLLSQSSYPLGGMGHTAGGMGQIYRKSTNCDKFTSNVKIDCFL